MSFYFRKVDAYTIEKYINKLDFKKAPGIDKIRVKDIKQVKKKISPVLAKFINMCVDKGAYPDILKKSIIRPIYKQGTHLDYGNYRPVAILSVINKLTEKVIINQISRYLEQNSIISEAQHGFRRGRSTATALAQFTDYVNNNLNEGKFVAALFIDYKKAFDTLEHEVLLRAMEECGIRGPISRWFKCYLQNRTIRTSIEGTTGEEVSVSLGVPTGSVYGPVGYIMHVNSVTNVIKHCKTFMYADDMCLMYSSNNPRDAQMHIQEDFENIIKWAHDNGIIINFAKTKAMYISSPYSHYNKQSKLSIPISGHTYECLHHSKIGCQCIDIEVVDKFRYLGLTVDSDLNWKLHVNNVCNKLQSILSKFFHLSSFVNRKVLYVLYYALVDSIISYGLSSYGLTFKTQLDRIKQLQIRIMKYLVSKKVRVQCKPDYDQLFTKCKILPVHALVEYLIAIEQYKLSKYKKPITHQYRTRRVEQGKYVIPSVKNYYGKRTRQYITPVIFNKLEFIRNISKDVSTVVIKKRLKEVLL